MSAHIMQGCRYLTDLKITLAVTAVTENFRELWTVCIYDGKGTDPDSGYKVADTYNNEFAAKLHMSLILRQLSRIDWNVPLMTGTNYVCLEIKPTERLLENIYTNLGIELK